MVENKVNWNTVLVVLVIGVVGILLLSNSGLLSGETIKVQKVTTGTDIYTKTEIDAKLGGVYLGSNTFSLNSPTGNSGATTPSVWIRDIRVTLLNVGEGGSVLINVNGVGDTVSQGSTKLINGLSITNLGINYNTETSKRSAVLKIA